MRALIRRLSRENVLWSAERIHGHVVLLGLEPPCPDTIRKYMVKPRGGPEKSQNWLTFLRNHVQVSWAMDFLTVVTIRFQILYVFVVLNHARRQVVHFGVTAQPTMPWVIQQLREAMPFGVQPRYMFQDNDGICGDEVPLSAGICRKADRINPARVSQPRDRAGRRPPSTDPEGLFPLLP